MRIWLLLVIYAGLLTVAFGQKNSVKINLTDNRPLIARKINRKLVLRIIKDRSVTQANFGWVVEVNRRPVKNASKNLIYTNKFGKGADASQIAAWQFSPPDPQFPARRIIKARRAPYTFEISVINPRATGKSDDAAFVSGQLRVVWRYRPR